jgi:hypothetical protein
MEEEGRDGGTRADLAFILNSISVASKVRECKKEKAGAPENFIKKPPRR